MTGPSPSRFPVNIRFLFRPFRMNSFLVLSAWRTTEKLLLAADQYAAMHHGWLSRSDRVSFTRSAIFWGSRRASKSTALRLSRHSNLSRGDSLISMLERRSNLDMLSKLFRLSRFLVFKLCLQQRLNVLIAPLQEPGNIFDCSVRPFPPSFSS